VTGCRRSRQEFSLKVASRTTSLSDRNLSTSEHRAKIILRIRPHGQAFLRQPLEKAFSCSFYRITFFDLFRVLQKVRLLHCFFFQVKQPLLSGHCPNFESITATLKVHRYVLHTIPPLEGPVPTLLVPGCSCSREFALVNCPKLHLWSYFCLIS